LKRVAVIGASGYTGAELLRLLANHSNVEVTVATSREYADKPISMVHPHLRGIYNMKFTKFDIDKSTSLAGVFFLAVPHGASLNITPKLLEVGVTVIDLSADFRLKDPKSYEEWYSYNHPYPDLLRKSVYGMPEIHREELKGAKLVAVPGCNATATILASLPIVRKFYFDKLISDVKVASSEGGMKPTEGSHHPERENAIRPYDAEGHRHSAEVEQELSLIAKRKVIVSIILHAVSSVRGVLASIHLWINDDLNELDIWRYIAETYRGEPFIRIVRGGIHPYPDPKYVIGSNFADIGFSMEKRAKRLTIFAAIDNMMKGASGQAIQAFNITQGYDEREGLKYAPLRPG